MTYGLLMVLSSLLSTACAIVGIILFFKTQNMDSVIVAVLAYWVFYFLSKGCNQELKHNLDKLNTHNNEQESSSL